MKTKFQLLIIRLITAITFLFILSCNEPELTAPTTNNTIQETNLEKDINPKALACDQRIVYQWELSCYKPVIGKKIGFNPNIFSSTQEMKDKFGFSKVLVNESQKESAIAAGFTFPDMVGRVNRDNMTYPSGDFDYYHIDEVAENGVSIYDIYNLAEELYPKKLLLSSYKIGWLDPWNDIQNYYSLVCTYYSNTEIMSDNYFGPVELLEYCTDDQRVYWDDFQDRYASRNKMNWISLLIDGKQWDFNDLFSYANNKGFNEMWLYIGDAGDDYCGGSEVLTSSKFDQYIYRFSSYAFNKGWLRRFEKLYRYDYRCFLRNPCETCDQEDLNSAGWYFERSYTGQEREVFN
jgi:hypothetical protein